MLPFLGLPSSPCRRDEQLNGERNWLDPPTPWMDPILPLLLRRAAKRRAMLAGSPGAMDVSHLQRILGALLVVFINGEET